ncbi:hypothetical protein BGZ73_001549 [Actinomortierella ambigua]|nr:hypothetical protein BGZ73_001549 [Actinomortierella ambigua]
MSGQVPLQCDRLRSTHESTAVALALALLHAGIYIQPFHHVPHLLPATATIVLAGFLCVSLIALIWPHKNKHTQFAASACLQAVFTFFGVETITTTILPRTIQLPAACCFVTTVLVTARFIEDTINLDHLLARQAVDRDEPASSALAIDPTFVTMPSSNIGSNSNVSETEGFKDHSRYNVNHACKGDRGDDCNSGDPAAHSRLNFGTQLAAYDRSHRHEAKTRKSIVVGRIRLHKDQAKLPQLPSSFVRAAFFGQSERVIIHHPFHLHVNTAANDNPCAAMPLHPQNPDANDMSPPPHKRQGNHYLTGDPLEAFMTHDKNQEVLMNNTPHLDADGGKKDDQKTARVNDDLCRELAISEVDPIASPCPYNLDNQEPPIVWLRSSDPTMTTIAAAMLDELSEREEEPGLSTAGTSNDMGTDVGSIQGKIACLDDPSSMQDSTASTAATDPMSSSMQLFRALEQDVRQSSVQMALAAPRWSKWHKSKTWRAKLKACLQLSSNLQQLHTRTAEAQQGPNGLNISTSSSTTTTTMACNDMRLLISPTVPRTSNVGLFGAPPEFPVAPPSSTPRGSSTSPPSSPSLDSSATDHQDSTPLSPRRQLHSRQASDASEDSFYFITEFAGYPQDARKKSSEGNSSHPMEDGADDKRRYGGFDHSVEFVDEDEDDSSLLREAFLSFLDIDE